jgi:hypothetical protein
VLEYFESYKSLDILSVLLTFTNKRNSIQFILAILHYTLFTIAQSVAILSPCHVFRLSTKPSHHVKILMTQSVTGSTVVRCTTTSAVAYLR